MKKSLTIVGILMILLGMIVVFLGDKYSSSNSIDHQIFEENKITKIIISTYGGRSDIVDEIYQVTKDSLIHSVLYKDSKDIEVFANNSKKWQNLISKIDLEVFKQVKDGSSNLPSCDSDTSIHVFTNNNKITKTNATDSMLWNEIRIQVFELFRK